jgi:hypothetical protein
MSNAAHMVKDLFERRKLEAFLAASTGGFGLFLLLPADSMSSAAFAFVTADISEPAWGLAFAMNGAAHSFALAVNGSRWWSPLVRCWAAVYSAILYAILTAGFMAYSLTSTAVWTYGCLSFGSVIAAAYAWRDSLKAVKVRYALANHS